MTTAHSMKETSKGAVVNANISECPATSFVSQVKVRNKKKGASFGTKNSGEVDMATNRHNQHYIVDVASQKYKSSLRCLQYLETGTLEKKEATRRNENIFKCGSCSKRATGKAVVALIDVQIGAM